jgi:Ser/Thr protein kinase RdoA (MazF antagonist)
VAGAPPGRVLAALVRSGLVDAGAACDGAVSVLDASRSNPVYRVAVDGLSRYVVKQAGPDVETGSPLAAEQAAYRWLAAEPSVAALAPGTAALSGDDGWLVLDAVVDARPLHELIAEVDGDCVPLLATLARTIATLHGAGARDAGNGLLAVRRPWLLDLPSGPLPPFAAANPAAVAAAGELRAQPALMAVVEGLAGEWRPCTVIHGDVKWDNVLVRRRPDGAWRLWLVDWELAGWGDPAWDLGGIVEGIVTGFAAEPGTVAPLVRTVVGAYRDAAPPELAPHPESLVRAVAARLVQAVVQVAATGDSEELAALRRRLLELAAVLAADPEHWGRVLVGDAR